MPKIYSRDALPSDPETWTRYAKKETTPATLVDGPARVVTKNGPIVVNEARFYLAIDGDDYPYPIEKSILRKHFRKVEGPKEGS